MVSYMLNEKQQIAYEEVIHGTNPIVILLGQGGTGKTYTTAKIIQDYRGSIAVTATTNRAKQVITNMSGMDASTIHSQMGYTMVRSGREEYLSKVREPITADLVIVEEISMLIKPIFDTLMKELSEGKIKKILFLGDPVQLPPIGIGFKLPASGTTIELTEQMRQSHNPELVSYFSGLREAISTHSKNFKFDPYPSLVHVTENHSEFCNLYKQTLSNKKILAYTNTVVDKYNLHINGKGFFVGDEVIIDKPLGTCTNGDSVLIFKVDEYDKYYDLGVIANGAKYPIRYYKSKSAYLKDLEKAKDYWEFVDMCYNVKHQYACTVHKSQGSTYDVVFIDFTDIIGQWTKKPSKWNNFKQPISYNTFLRLYYVSLSRMKSKAVVFIGDKREYNKLKDNK